MTYKGRLRRYVQLNSLNLKPPPLVLPIVMSKIQRSAPSHEHFSIFSGRWFSFMFFTNVVLHCLQVGGLAFLVGRHIQNRPLVSLSDGTVPSLLSLKFNLLPSVVFKVYGIILAFLTQSLTLERESLSKQTLTNIHDKTSAWMGELKATTALLHQHSAKKGTFWRIGFVLLYLICITVLSTAASSIVAYVWVPGDQTFTNITYLFPNVTTDDIKDAYPILSVLPVMDVFQVAAVGGVFDNLVFDPPFAVDTIINGIAAVRFDVNCQALKDAHQSGPIRVNATTDSVMFPFHVDDTIQDVEFSLGTNLLTIVGANLTDNGQDLSPLPTLLLASTIPISDSDNSTLAARSMSVISPPLAFPNCQDQNCLSYSQVQILACDMAPAYLNISIDGSDGWPVHARELLNLNYTWSEWTGPPSLPRDLVHTTLGAFVSQSPASNTKYNLAFVNNSARGVYTQTLLEETLMEILGVEDVEDPWTSLYLSDVNLAIGSALATVYWRAMLTLSNTHPPPAKLADGTSNAPQDGYKILVNAYTPYISLVMSVIALMLAVILTWPAKQSSQARKRRQSVPTDLGVLQMFWLFCNAQQNIDGRAVDPNDIKHLQMSQLRHTGEQIIVNPLGQTDDREKGTGSTDEATTLPVRVALAPISSASDCNTKAVVEQQDKLGPSRPGLWKRLTSWRQSAATLAPGQKEHEGSVET